MTDYKQYMYSESTTAVALEAVIKDIQDTCEFNPQYSERYKQQSRVILAIHDTLKHFYEDGLYIFIGTKFIHWFAFGNNSVHFKRDELLHLSDREISKLMTDTIINQGLWLECDFNALEDTMPHKRGKAMCLDCGHRSNVLYSIFDEQRTQVCKICETTSIIVDLKNEKNTRPDNTKRF